MKKLIAIFSKNKDAQSALNAILESGLSEEALSLVMKDIEEDLPDSTSSSDELDSNEDDQSFDNFDNNNITNTDSIGVFEPLGAVTVSGGRLDAQGEGDYILAGKIAESYENLEVEDPEDQSYELDWALVELGIEDSELEAYHSRIDAGQILFLIDAEDSEIEEYRALFGDAGAEVIEELLNE